MVYIDISRFSEPEEAATNEVGGGYGKMKTVTVCGKQEKYESFNIG